MDLQFLFLFFLLFLPSLPFQKNKKIDRETTKLSLANDSKIK